MKRNLRKIRENRWGELWLPVDEALNLKYQLLHRSQTKEGTDGITGIWEMV